MPMYYKSQIGNNGKMAAHFFNGGYLDYLGADAENQKEGEGKLPSDGMAINDKRFITLRY